MEGLAASVAMHRCHDLWNLVLLKAAFRQPTGCLATAAFIVIGIGAHREENLAGCLRWIQGRGLGSDVSQKLEWVEKRKAILCRDWPGASFSPTHPTILRLRQWAFACTKELFPFRRQLFKKPTNMATMSNQSLRAAVRSVGRLNGRTARSSGLMSRQFSTSPAHGTQLEEWL